ncbi:metallophosphoesterase [Candidatus Curtissbacteria bacterium]|nr:metallophosphoesterase [Candidatus Curtissbacteria bacterium]
MLVAVVAAVFLSDLRNLSNLSNLSQQEEGGKGEKRAILRIGLVADSHNENELLAKALRQVFDREAQTESAQGKGINFVIGLGDYTNLGTVEELKQAKEVFEKSKLEYYLTAGDRDGWESRGKGDEGPTNFIQIFGPSNQVVEREGVQFVLLDNSNLYKGIGEGGWNLLEKVSKVTKGSNVSKGSNKTFETSETSETFDTSKLIFVFAHKTPFHPESSHTMGEDSPEVAKQAEELLAVLEGKGSQESQGSRGKKVDGFFSGDLHFFASYLSPAKIVKMTTVGAVASERNFGGPRFAILTVFNDYSWEVEDVEIR